MGPRLKALVDRSSGVWPCQGRPRRGRRGAAGRRPVLDTARRQSRLASKVSRRGLAAGGGRQGRWRRRPFLHPLPEGRGRDPRRRRGKERGDALSGFTPAPCRRAVKLSSPSPSHCLAMGPSLSLWERVFRVCARRSADEGQRFQHPELSRPDLVLPPPNRPYPVSHLAAGKGRKASDRCGGGGRSSGTGLEGVTPACPGTPVVGGARPPSASNGDRARVLPIGPRPRRPGLVGNDRNRVRLSLNRAAHRKLADNDGAERQASSKRYLFKHSGRRPALRDPFHQLTARLAWDHTPLPPPDRCAVCPPPEGAEDARTARLLFPLWGKTTAKRSVGGKGSPHRTQGRRP
jgi:hypothetical protein